EAGSEAEAAGAAERLQAILAQTRQQAEQARLKLGSFETATRMRDSRLAQLARDGQSWQRRRDGAMAQLATLDQRQAEVAAQLESVSATPDDFSARRVELEERIEQAQHEHREAGDTLNTAQ